MSCRKCGRRDGHNLGCREAARKRREAQGARSTPSLAPSRLEASKPEGHNDPPAPADQCTKDGCSEPRAASKGPRPAKYCEGHKFKRKAKE